MPVRTLLTGVSTTALRCISRRVCLSEMSSDSQSFQEKLNDLKDTLHAQGGVAISAPQIGVPERMVIIGSTASEMEKKKNSAGFGCGGSIDGIPWNASKELVMINPEIIWAEKERSIGMWETCLSVPNSIGFVERPQKIEVQFTDDLDCANNVRSMVLEGSVAGIVQHEVDHLDGILFVDRVTDPEKLLRFKTRKKLMAFLKVVNSLAGGS